MRIVVRAASGRTDYSSLGRNRVPQLGQRAATDLRPQPGQRTGSGSSTRAHLRAGAVLGGGVGEAGSGEDRGGAAGSGDDGRDAVGRDEAGSGGDGAGAGPASDRTTRAAGESPIGSPHSRHRSAPSSTSALHDGHLMARS